MPTRRLDRGFTLVELMVVISILGLLVMLLVPVVSSARLVASKAATTDTIKRLGLALDAYKMDFREYPPSRPSWNTGTDVQCGKMYRGAANLVYYLGGPTGDGWGLSAAGNMPYANLSKPSKSYGPYFKASTDMIAFEMPPSGSGDGSGRPMMGAVLDAFKPSGKILYFRYENNPEIVNNQPVDRFQVSDNAYTAADKDGDKGTDKSPPLGGRKNYYSQAYFMDAVKIDMEQRDSQGNTIYRYVRNDFILASPGADGVYGWVQLDANSNLPVPVTRDNTAAKVAKGYDDITNFN